MKIPNEYHSAFREEISDLKEIDYYINGNSLVKYHDINNGIINEFYNCDVIYSEPSWRKGYLEFSKRAYLKINKNFNDYLMSIQHVVNELKKPSFIIGGRHMLNILKPDHLINIKFNGFDAITMIWNHEKINVSSNLELIEIISKKYNKVLDFSCGYGFHLKKFRYFVCTDINKKCVYYIAKKYLGYKDD